MDGVVFCGWCKYRYFDLLSLLYEREWILLSSFDVFTGLGWVGGGVGEGLVMLLAVLIYDLATYGPKRGGRRSVRGRAGLGVRADTNSVAIGLCGRAPGRHSGFVGLIRSNACRNALFRHIVGSFVVRTNSPRSGGTPGNGVLKTNSINCAIPTRFICPGCFRGGNTLSTTHRNSRIGPSGTSSNYRFCVIAKGICGSSALLKVRRRVGRVHLGGTFGTLTRGRVGRVCGVHGGGSRSNLVSLRSSLVTRTRTRITGRPRFGFAPRRIGTCAAINNAPRLSNTCAIFNRILRNVSVISGVRGIGASHGSHPRRSIIVGGIAIVS